MAQASISERALAALQGGSVPRPVATRTRPLDSEAAWAALAQVLDPEVPVLSVVELGIVREVDVDAAGHATVVVTPTYSGCPATEAIDAAIVAALIHAGATGVTVRQRHAPAWSTDWLGAEAREKLRQYGIAPPAHLVGTEGLSGTDGDSGAARPLRFHPRGLSCPRCGSAQCEQLSAFGATACKALYRCMACREPFEYFKPI